MERSRTTQVLSASFLFVLSIDNDTAAALTDLSLSDSQFFVLLISDAPAGTYLDLSATQMQKLKQLSLVSIAAKQKVVPYHEMQSAVGIEDRRSFEDLLIETIYAVRSIAHITAYSILEYSKS